MKPLKKDADNPFFKSSYVTLDNILSAIKEPLKEAGLTFVQIPVGEGLRTILIDIESGESLEGTFTLMPAKNDPQGQGSAITYARRYALSAILGLSTEEDDDGNKASTPEKPSDEPYYDEPFPDREGSCPQCKQGSLIEKKGKFGPFKACNRYPDCKYIAK